MRTAKEEKDREKNQGFSLIEVIVSMLILSIIVLPLLQNFLAAQGANHKSKKIQYATQLNSSVMEGIKEFSIEETAVQFFETDPAAFYLVSHTAFTPSGAYYQIKEDGSRIESENACVKNGKFINNQQKYYFYISGVKQGTGNYDVKISYDSSAYAGIKDASGNIVVGQNSYEMPKAEALDANFYALIDPFSAFRNFVYNGTSYELVSNDDYDTRVRSFFYQLHQNYYKALWTDACQEVQRQNAAAQIEWEKNGGELVFKPLPTQIPVKSKSTINQTIDRTIQIIVNKSASGYSVNGKLIYSTHSTDGELWEVGTQEKIYDLYGTGLSFTTLKGIYLFYPLYEAAESGESYDYRQNEKLEIIVNGGPLTEDLDFYIAMQEEEVPVTYRKLDVTCSDSHIKIHSQETLRLNGIEQTSNLVGKYEASDRIYDVTVEVYESGTSKLLSSMTSTIRQ